MLRQFPKLIFTALLFCLCFPLCCSAQANGPASQQPPGRVADELELQRQREIQKKENAKRQQEIRNDTEKLLDLATELKHYVDKSNENTLSVDVIKKAEQIEKLAHAIKEKMKGP
jgi:hypothetical protein